MAGAPTSYGYPGSVNAAILADWLTRASHARFSVGGKDDWKVTVQPGLDRGIRINGGIGVGDSVMDVFPDYDTRSLPIPAGTSQWFLIAARRNWSTPASTNFVVIPGTSSRVVPDRADAPGQESDQPVALVRVQANNTVVQEIVDLRAWAGNGGVEAADILGRDQLARPGAAVKVGADIHRYEYTPANGGSFRWKVYPTTNLTVPVANKAERDGLASQWPNNTLPVNLSVGRTDIPGLVETWNGSKWISNSGAVHLELDFKAPRNVGGSMWGPGSPAAMLAGINRAASRNQNLFTFPLNNEVQVALEGLYAISWAVTDFDKPSGALILISKDATGQILSSKSIGDGSSDITAERPSVYLPAGAIIQFNFRTGVAVTCRHLLSITKIG